MDKANLTMEAAKQIGGAIDRLNQIGTGLIVKPGDEAESKALENWLKGELLKYAQQLLGSYFVIKTEYEPLVMGVAGILRRATAPQGPTESEVGAK